MLLIKLKSHINLGKKMNNDEKLHYFEGHLQEIWTSKSNSLVGFLEECLKEKELKSAFQSWPDEIKIKIVERYLEDINSTK